MSAVQVVQSTQEHPAVKKKKAFLIIGIIELAIGGVMFIMGIVNIASPSLNYVNSSSGLWDGVFMCAAGGLGVATTKYPNQWTVTGGLVVTIFVAIASFSGMIVESIHSSLTCGFRSYFIFGWSSQHASCRAVHGLLAFLCSVGFVVSIIHSALCCGVVCCGANTAPVTSSTVTTMTTIPQGSQQVQYQVPPPGYTTAEGQKQAIV